MLLKGAEISRYLTKPDPTRPALLIYGQDAMRVALKRAEAVASLTGENAEQEMRLTRLAGADLRRDTAALMDEIKATGFFSGPRVVLVEDTPDTAAPAIRAALDAWAPGDAVIVVAAGACALASTIDQLVWLRALWGLGNAFFIATALSVIVGAAAGSHKGAILMYEAALGLGLAVGPLLGAVLGGISWRGPFAGTAILMAVGAILCATMLTPDTDKAHRTPIKITDPIRALRDRSLRLTSIGSALYTAAFFAIIAWAPFVLDQGAYFIGLVFFGWGVCVALSGVLLAPRVAARFGERRALMGVVLGYAAILVVIALGNTPVVVVGVVISGLLSGILNTLFTGAAMSSELSPRAVSSAGYNFLRWMGGAVSAILVGHIAAWTGNISAPFWAAAACCLVAAGVLSRRDNAVPEPAAGDAQPTLIDEAEGAEVVG